MSFYQQLQQATAAERQQMLEAPVIAACRQGRIGREGYLAFLEHAYHHVKHTVPLLMACGSRLGQEFNWLEPALGEYISEEMGHHHWILEDISASGGDATAIEAGQPDWPIELMVAYLYHQIDRGSPLALFGMVQVLEGTSVALATELGQQIQKSLHLPDGAMHYLYSHGTLDQDHLRFFAGLMDRIEDPQHQRPIIDSARHCYRLYGEMLRRLPLLEETSHAA